MAHKRGNGEGTILKRKDGKGWQGQVTIGRDPETGKLKRVTYYGKTQKEVQQKINKAISELNDGTFIKPHTVTFGEWADKWLEDYKRPPNVKLSTYVSYEMLIRQHLKPKLGSVLLKDLNSEVLQKFYNEQVANGRSDGKGGLSPKTLRNLHNMIHECLQQAVYNNLIHRNISEATNLPKCSNKKEIRVLSKDEMQRFLRIISKERLKCAYILLLGSGIRLGELLALKWSDINFESGIMSINKTLNRLKTLDENSPTKTRLIFQEPKTDKGKRLIPLSPKILDELLLHKSRQDDEKELAEGIFNDIDLVFCSTIGTPIDPRSLIRNLHNICKNSGIKRINIHAMRHTYATRLLEANQHPKIVQELLGHSNISMTLDIYSHVMPDVKKSAVQTLDSLFNNDEVKKDDDKED